VQHATAARPSVRFVWLAHLFGRLLAVYVRIVAATSRVSGTLTDGQAVLVFWHEYNLIALIVMLARRRGLRHVSFSTRGFRGLVVTTMLARLGVRAIPLPDEGANRAEARALAVAMARLAGEGFSLAVTPDGPFGPYRAAKPGAAIVAQAAGLPIVPLAFQTRPAPRLGRRWDRQLVPMPFGRIRVEQGMPMRIGPNDRIRRRLAELQAELNRIADDADRRDGMSRRAAGSST
jgi:lysophospholipid acyltransferase (LPLAT)-like uncharacterized protein